MFVNMLAWRVEFGVDDLRAQPVSPWQDIRELLVPECTHATDKAGRPLYVAVYGPMDAERLTAEIAPPMQWVLEVHRLEQFDVLEQRLSVETGQRVTSLAWLLDASGCTLGHFGLMPWVRATSEVGQPYYPDFMGQLVVINVPSFFPVLWRVCGAWFDQRVRDEMCLLGSDYQHELRERIGAAGLCREYGGDCNKCGGHCAPSLQPFQDKQQQQRQQQQHEVAALLQSGTTPLRAHPPACLARPHHQHRPDSAPTTQQRPSAHNFHFRRGSGVLGRGRAGSERVLLTVVRARHWSWQWRYGRGCTAYRAREARGSGGGGARLQAICAGRRGGRRGGAVAPVKWWEQVAGQRGDSGSAVRQPGRTSEQCRAAQ